MRAEPFGNHSRDERRGRGAGGAIRQGTEKMLTRNMAVRAGALLAALAPAPAFAATASSTLNVDATVTANCTVSTSALSFGNVDPFGGSNVDASGGITVTCTNGTDWSAAAGIGSGTGASYAARRMSAGSDLLA